MSTIKKKTNNNNKTLKTRDNYKKTAFYPVIKPFESNFLKVSELHTIAYHLYGNQKGKPVLFIHGGPGGGTMHDYARFFNPKKYFIILVDQRHGYIIFCSFQILNNFIM